MDASTDDSETTRQRGEDARPTVLAELKISEIAVTRVNDHKAIFVNIQGAPIDKGAWRRKSEGYHVTKDSCWKEQG